MLTCRYSWYHIRLVCADIQVMALVQVRVQGTRSPAQWPSQLQAFCRQQGFSRFKVPGLAPRGHLLPDSAAAC